jgi:hypothetical protein
MASLRKKYQGLVVDNSKEPVTTAPTTDLAKLPEPVADAPQMPEEMKAESPVEEAAKSAIKQRLEESQRAAEIAKQQPPQQPPQQRLAETPQQQEPVDPLEQAIAGLPERAKAWYRADSRWLTDPERAAHINYAHHVAVRETGAEGSDDYFERMEHMLGLRSVAMPEPQPMPERKVSAPTRPQYSGAPVSAPPSRESPSYSTGRPVTSQAPLTRDELEIARASRISPQEYQKQKEKMLRLKAAGAIQDA